MTEIIDFLKKYTDGKQNTEKVEISVLQLNRVIKALEQTFCKDAEYEKDLNEVKEQILKESNTLVSKRDLFERFCEIDKEYKGHPWNLLQILANINILIGEEPCEDAISRAEAQTEIEMNASRYTISKERGDMGQVEWSDQLIKVSDAVNIIRHLPSVTPSVEPQESEE